MAAPGGEAIKRDAWGLLNRFCEAPVEHRGVEYWVRKLDESRWEWTIYPSKNSRVSKARGTVRGSRDDAEAACKREIDSGLDGISVQ